jgi:hypothetical protein
MCMLGLLESLIGVAAMVFAAHGNAGLPPGSPSDPGSCITCSALTTCHIKVQRGLCLLDGICCVLLRVLIALHFGQTTVQLAWLGRLWSGLAAGLDNITDVVHDARFHQYHGGLAQLT